MALAVALSIDRPHPFSDHVDLGFAAARVQVRHSHRLRYNSGALASTAGSTTATVSSVLAGVTTARTAITSAASTVTSLAALV